MAQERYFHPNITVAHVIRSEHKFLFVQERVKERITLNQPAGHLETDESIIEAVQRETFEECGLHLIPQSLIKVFQWIAPDKMPFIRFTFASELAAIPKTKPHDPDIIGCVWLSDEEFVAATNLRSPLVRESIIAYHSSERYSISLFDYFRS